jgi:hypothetical protein
MDHRSLFHLILQVRPSAWAFMQPSRGKSRGQTNLGITAPSICCSLVDGPDRSRDQTDDTNLWTICICDGSSDSIDGTGSCLSLMLKAAMAIRKSSLHSYRSPSEQERCGKLVLSEGFVFIKRSVRSYLVQKADARLPGLCALANCDMDALRNCESEYHVCTVLSPAPAEVVPRGAGCLHRR